MVVAGISKSKISIKVWNFLLRSEKYERGMIFSTLHGYKYDRRDSCLVVV